MTDYSASTFLIISFC